MSSRRNASGCVVTSLLAVIVAVIFGVFRAVLAAVAFIGKLFIKKGTGAAETRVSLTDRERKSMSLCAEIKAGEMFGFISSLYARDYLPSAVSRWYAAYNVELFPAALDMARSKGLCDADFVEWLREYARRDGEPAAVVAVMARWGDDHREKVLVPLYGLKDLEEFEEVVSMCLRLAHPDLPANFYFDRNALNSRDVPDLHISAAYCDVESDAVLNPVKVYRNEKSAAELMGFSEVRSADVDVLSIQAVHQSGRGIAGAASRLFERRETHPRAARSGCGVMVFCVLVTWLSVNSMCEQAEKRRHPKRATVERVVKKPAVAAPVVDDDDEPEATPKEEPAAPYAVGDTVEGAMVPGTAAFYDKERLGHFCCFRDNGMLKEAREYANSCNVLEKAVFIGNNRFEVVEICEDGTVLLRWEYGGDFWARAEWVKRLDR